MKKTTAYSLDVELIDEVVIRAKQEGFSSSQFVNEYLKKMMIGKKDLLQRYKEVLQEKEDISKKEQDLLRNIEKIKIEGNLEQRQEAEKVLKEVKEKEQEKVDQLNHYLTIIQKSQYYPELIGQKLDPDDVETLGDYATKMQEEGLKVGVYQLRQLIKEGLINGN